MTEDLAELEFGIVAPTRTLQDVGGDVPDAQHLGTPDILAGLHPAQQAERLVESPQIRQRRRRDDDGFDTGSQRNALRP